MPSLRNDPISPVSSGDTRSTTLLAPFLESRSRTFRSAVERLERYARFDDVVLLIGESGTGKSYFAQHLHNRSPRANRVLHRVSLSAVADSLAPSDLFGHVRGAFTDARERRAGHFASAHGGTLFLDEIGKASEQVQHKLLDAVERGEIAPVGGDRMVKLDVRIVAATNVCLHGLAKVGRFLPDLVARLDGFTVKIPPLRERSADIPLLANHFVALHAARYGYRSPPPIHADLMDALCRAPWPNNVRELDVSIRKLLVEGSGTRALTVDLCVDALSYLRPKKKKRVAPPDIAVLRVAVAAADGDVPVAARMLDIARSSFYRYLNAGSEKPSSGPAE